MIPLVLLFFNQFSHYTVLIHLLFVSVILDISILTGAQFAFASELYTGSVNKSAAVNYSADLLGSAIGALLSSVLLIPLLGINNVCFVLAGMNLICVLLLHFRR
ncbi:MAG: hypothetical protein A2491_07115 [Bacteroidetes bacterium RIFOXYC12_FULL_35_7]|nr:MAG: hypothetical protein A2491_07115 [Bacteroidetes bacterium RIFOXYC12_FULL_35_7]